MTTDKSRAFAPPPTERTLASRAEDHSLGRVPVAQRQSGWRLSTSTVGMATGLAMFSVGGFAVVLGGFVWGMLAGVCVTVLGVVIGYLVGNISHAEGVSSTVASRFHGFGVRGSAVSAVIFAFMILGFLALENALLYNATLLIFDWDDTLVTKLLIYGVLTIAWILLAVFGLNLALNSSMLMIAATFILCVVVIVIAFRGPDVSPSQVFQSPGIVPGGGWAKFQAAFGLMGGTAGTIALVTADFARHARSKVDVGVLAAAGPFFQNIVVTVLGAMVMIGGTPAVVSFLISNDPSLSTQQAAQAAVGFGLGNTGAYFVVIAGWAGFLTIYAAQAKAQALNTYSGSLALVNLVDALFKKTPGRVVMVVVGNLLALIMISVGILDHFSEWIAYLGVMTLSFCGVMIADFYLVHRGRRDSTEPVDIVNWAGVIAVIVASVVGIALIATNTMPLGFLLSMVLTLVLYPALRLSVLPRGAFTRSVDPMNALREASPGLS